MKVLLEVRAGPGFLFVAPGWELVLHKEKRRMAHSGQVLSKKGCQ